MATANFLFGIAKKYFTVGLISLTEFDRYVSPTAIRGSSMSPTLNPHDEDSAAIWWVISYFTDRFYFVGKIFTGLLLVPADDYALVEKYKFSHGDVVVFR